MSLTGFGVMIWRSVGARVAVPVIGVSARPEPVPVPVPVPP